MRTLVTKKSFNPLAICQAYFIQRELNLFLYLTWSLKSKRLGDVAEREDNQSASLSWPCAEPHALETQSNYL